MATFLAALLPPSPPPTHPAPSPCRWLPWTAGDENLVFRFQIVVSPAVAPPEAGAELQ